MSEATSQPAAQTTGGGSILTEGVGNPQGAELDKAQPSTQTNGAAPAGQRPDYIPEKFWKADKNEADYEALGKSYISLDKLLGGEKVPVPRSDDDQEGWERYFKAGGRPDKEDGYEFKVETDKLPEGFYDQEAEKAYRQWAYQNGLNKRQAANLHEAYVKTNLERHQAWTEQQRNSKEKLRADLIREHGRDYEGFEKAAKAAMGKFADPDFIKFLDETGHGNDPRMIRAFGRIGKSMMGDTQLKGAPTAPDVGDIDKALSALHQNPAYLDRSHPDHARLVAEAKALYQKKFPDPQ